MRTFHLNVNSFLIKLMKKYFLFSSLASFLEQATRRDTQRHTYQNRTAQQRPSKPRQAKIHAHTGDSLQFHVRNEELEFPV